MKFIIIHSHNGAYIWNRLSWNVYHTAVTCTTSNADVLDAFLFYFRVFCLSRWLIEYLYFVIADDYRNSYKNNNKNTEVYKSIK